MARPLDHRVRRCYELSGEVDRDLIMKALGGYIRDVLFSTKCNGKIIKVLENLCKECSRVGLER